MAPADKAKDYIAPKNLLQGRTILVTGAGDGIGRCVSMAAASHGATVILLGKTLSKLESVYDEIVAEGRAEPGLYPLDLAGATKEDYAQLAQILGEKYSLLHGLLHNAGILGERLPLQFYNLDTFNQVMQVNFNASIPLTQALLPMMQVCDDAAILFTTSGVGQKPRAYWGAYALSKYAIEGLSYLLADELGTTTSIRVNLINPGATRTRMRAEAYAAENPSSVKTPEEIVNAYLFLLGPDSKGINGQRINAQ